MRRRTERIGKVMQQAIARILMTELADPRIEPARTSVTRVEVQEDLLRAKVYISIYGSEAQQRRGLEALQHSAGRIQALLRRQVQLRSMPVLDFRNDERFKGTLKTFEIIRQAMDELRAKDQADAGQDAPPTGEETPTDSDESEKDEQEQ
jgi:ribosome-binding factor A